MRSLLALESNCRENTRTASSNTCVRIPAGKRLLAEEYKSDTHATVTCSVAHLGAASLSARDCTMVAAHAPLSFIRERRRQAAQKRRKLGLAGPIFLLAGPARQSHCCFGPSLSLSLELKGLQLCQLDARPKLGRPILWQFKSSSSKRRTATEFPTAAVFVDALFTSRFQYF